MSRDVSMEVAAWRDSRPLVDGGRLIALLVALFIALLPLFVTDWVAIPVLVAIQGWFLLDSVRKACRRRFAERLLHRLPVSDRFCVHLEIQQEFDPVATEIGVLWRDGDVLHFQSDATEFSLPNSVVLPSGHDRVRGADPGLRIVWRDGDTYRRILVLKGSDASQVAEMIERWRAAEPVASSGSYPPAELRPRRSRRLTLRGLEFVVAWLAISVVTRLRLMELGGAGFMAKVFVAVPHVVGILLFLPVIAGEVRRIQRELDALPLPDLPTPLPVSSETSPVTVRA